MSLHEKSNNLLTTGNHSSNYSIPSDATRRPVGRPKSDREIKKRISLIMYPSLYENLSILALIRRESISEIVGELVTRLVDNNAEEIEKFKKTKFGITVKEILELVPSDKQVEIKPPGQQMYYEGAACEVENDLRNNGIVQEISVVDNILRLMVDEINDDINSTEEKPDQKNRVKSFFSINDLYRLIPPRIKIEIKPPGRRMYYEGIAREIIPDLRRDGIVKEISAAYDTLRLWVDNKPALDMALEEKVPDFKSHIPVWNSQVTKDNNE